MFNISRTVNLMLYCLVTISSAGDIITTLKDDQCRAFSSCSLCITKSICTWCVTKSICTQQQCGNDNVIYPNYIKSLLTGPEFCPRVVESHDKTIYKHGDINIFEIKITQIYLHMAFTPWYCKIRMNGKDFTLKAVLLADTVYCEVFEIKNESENAYIEGEVKVVWDYNKAFDGSIHFKVCRCDLEPNCIACVKKKGK